MNHKSKRGFLPAVAILVFACGLRSALACAACYGQSNSAMAKGMNWGIFTLLGVVVTVLGGIAACGIYLARRSAAISAATAASAQMAELPAADSSLP